MRTLETDHHTNPNSIRAPSVIDRFNWAMAGILLFFKKKHFSVDRPHNLSDDLLSSDELECDNERPDPRFLRRWDVFF
ncbi:MAG: hypothetical protein ACRDAM_02060, partial [Casimicrobium sp.]